MDGGHPEQAGRDGRVKNLLHALRSGAMRLIEHYLPAYQFSETHRTFIQAPAARVLDAMARADLSDDRFVRALLLIRGLPMRLRDKLGGSPRPDPWRGFGLHRFVPLGRNEREIAFGLVGRFWQSAGGLVDMPDATAFATYAEPGVPKLVMTYVAEPADGGTRLTTITRVHCPDDASRRRFTPYWLLIRPASGFIRRRALKRVKAMAEAMPAA